MSDSFVTPWTIAHQAPLSMGFSRQEHWSGLPFSSPGDIPPTQCTDTWRQFIDSSVYSDLTTSKYAFLTTNNIWMLLKEIPTYSGCNHIIRIFGWIHVSYGEVTMYHYCHTMCLSACWHYIMTAELSIYVKTWILTKSISNRLWKISFVVLDRSLR